PLLEVQTAAAAIDLGRDAELTVRFMFPSDDAAKEALWPARDGLAMFRLALGALTQQAGRQKDMAPFVPLFRQAQLALRTATVEQQQTALRGSLRLSADPAVVVKMVPAVAAAIVKMQESAGRAQSMNNLKQIALAMHNYHDTYGSFPPHALMSKNGKPLLSWRVAILPFIEQ